MKKIGILLGVVLAFSPSLAFADSTISVTPPSGTDGIVDVHITNSNENGWLFIYDPAGNYVYDSVITASTFDLSDYAIPSPTNGSYYFDATEGTYNTFNGDPFGNLTTCRTTRSACIGAVTSAAASDTYVYTAPGGGGGDEGGGDEEVGTGFAMVATSTTANVAATLAAMTGASVASVYVFAFIAIAIPLAFYILNRIYGLFPQTVTARTTRRGRRRRSSEDRELGL